MALSQSKKVTRRRKQKQSGGVLRKIVVSPSEGVKISEVPMDSAEPHRESGDTESEQGLSKAFTRIRKLDHIAEELRQGKHFSTTRLTIVKGLCESPEATNRFVVHLAKLTQQRMQSGSCPEHLTPDNWSRYTMLAARAIPQMESYLEESTDDSTESLWRRLSEIQGAQNVLDYNLP